MNDIRNSIECRIGAESEAMNKVLSHARAFSRGNKPVLITGETGTGKTLLAKYIHSYTKNESEEKPFISLNLNALPSSIVERELFGNEKGAFTDAKECKQGFFELANGGTLFFDEIGEISLELQAKLLKVIEEKRFYRLGGKSPITSAFKLICATNRNLIGMIERGEFREDLYSRIFHFHIKIPSLAERRDDILPIVKAALPRWAADNAVHVNFEELPKDFLDYLVSFSGRGNVRGLEQIVTRVFALSPRLPGGKIDLFDWREALLDELPQGRNQRNEDPIRNYESFDKENFPGIHTALEEYEEKVYKQLLSQCSSKRELSNILRTSASQLDRKLKKFNITLK